VKKYLAGLWVLVASVLLVGCGDNQNETELAPVATKSLESTEGTPITISSDSNAQYFILENANQTITTKRIGSSGITYSKRLYDCKNRTVKYLGTGDTKEAMGQSTPDSKMGSISSGSIADELSLQVCK